MRIHQTTATQVNGMADAVSVEGRVDPAAVHGAAPGVRGTRGWLYAGLRRFVNANRVVSAWFRAKAGFLFQEVRCEDDLQRAIGDCLDETTRNVLEVGGIDRPLLSRGRGFEYDGLDVEWRERCRELYDSFFLQSVEEPIATARGYDLIFSRAVLEHVPDNARTLRNIYAALNPGGRTIHYVPCKHHPYSLCLRVVGTRLQRPLLDHLHPDSAAVGGYPAFFSHCSPGSMRRLLRRIGFVDVEIRPHYRAEDYFAFFFPLFLLVTLLNLCFRRLGWGFFASGMRIEARRPA